MIAPEPDRCLAQRETNAVVHPMQADEEQLELHLPMGDLFSFGAWVRQRRRVLDLTREELAHQLGCAVITIRRIENGERRPSKQLAARLADCLQIAPAERTAFLHAARSEAPVEPQAPPGPVIHPAATSAPPKTNQPQLPAPPGALIGREHDLAEVSRLLTRTRLLTLTGPGGTGKTRLALAAAAMHQATFAHGVCFVDLAPITEASLVPATIAQALHLREEIAQPLTSTLYDFLQQRHMLLVLDNLEHVLSAAPLLVDLLAACPRLTLLVTSRTQLRVQGEQIYPVPPLAVPHQAARELGGDAGPNAAAIEQFAAVALFVERARAVRPSFTLNDANAQAVAAICRHLDGLPLALELAAARMSVLSAAQLTTRLHAVFPTLTQGQRGAVPRQQTLRATMDWSYQLLAPAEQTLLRRLSVFAGGCTLEAVEGVCSGHGIAADACLDLLSNLVDASLVTAHEADGRLRYHLLETIRQYGAEQRREAHEADVETRHAAFFTDLACTAADRLTSSENKHWIRVLKLEYDNLRAALHWLLTHDPEQALALAGALTWFWSAEGYWSEGRNWIEQALARGAVNQNGALRGKGLFGAGLLAWLQDDYPAAQTYLAASERIWEALDDQRNLAFARIFAGGVHSRMWQFTEAAEKLESGLAIALQLGDPWLICVAQMGLGEVAIGKGDPAQGRAYLAAALGILRRVDDERLLAYTVMHLGQAHSALGEFAAAQRYFTENLTLHRRHGIRLGVGFALLGLAEVAAGTGDYAGARAYGRSAFLEFFALNLKRCMAESLERLAEWVLVQGHPIPATTLLGAADALRVTSASPVPPLRQPLHQQAIANLRSTLGAEAFAAGWDIGWALNLAALRAYVLTLTEADAIRASALGDEG